MTNPSIPEAQPTSNLPLIGRRALVGGASKGIGRACAELLAQQGASVTLLARSADVLEAVVGGLSRPCGQTHHAIVGDVGNPQQVLEAVHNAVENSGPFHIVVNNVAGPPGGKLVNSTIGQLQEAFGNHILFAHQLMQIVIHGMQKEGHGRFINIISTSVKQPLDGLGVSNTIRGAMASWAKTLANEVASSGITVNNVLPGATETERLKAIIEQKAVTGGRSVEEVRAEMLREIPAGRFASASEIASAVCFLASDAAAYINGTSIIVDGGRTRTLS
ncbi:MAG: SDR family oxidoreductase [Bradyrhizobiaceae bacterium]|nr:SDR family oxidoreductase [Bradyrhizobiaceae bacterium]